MLRQFIRFSKLEGGIYYGEITPEHNVVAMLMPHFVSRFQIQPFIIHDKTHRLCGVSDTKTWWSPPTRTWFFRRFLPTTRPIAGCGRPL